MTREDRSVSPTTHLLRNTINGNDVVIRKVLADFSDLLIFSRVTPLVQSVQTFPSQDDYPTLREAAVDLRSLSCRYVNPTMIFDRLLSGGKILGSIALSVSDFVNSDHVHRRLRLSMQRLDGRRTDYCT